MNLGKAHIAKTIDNHCGFTNVCSAQLVDSLLEIIKETLEKCEDVLITGLGQGSKWPWLFCPVRLEIVV
jgi:nucleoid DNA-binding protein